MIHIVVWVSLLLSVLNWVLFAAIAFTRAQANGHAPVASPAEGGTDVPAAPAKSGAAYSAAMLSIICLLVALVAAGVDHA